MLDVEWSYQLDALSSIFMLIITGVGLCIFVFATGYMHGDTGFYRFFAYLGLFMFSMLVLVMGSNFMMMFVGWEGVGLCSYLLIGYYFDRKEAGDASRKAFITNRIGDFGFALAVFAVIATFGTTQYTAVFEQARALPVEVLGSRGASCRGSRSASSSARAASPRRYRFRLAAGRDGWPDACLRADSRGDDGHGRALHADALQRHFPALADDDDWSSRSSAR